MDTTLKTLMILVELLIDSPQAALTHSDAEGVGDKLAHGVANTVTGLGEIPKNIMLGTNEKGIGYGLTAGLLTGIVHGVGRTLTGAVDLITFIIPTKPLIYPDYIWEDWDRETHYHPDWKLSTDEPKEKSYRQPAGGSYEQQQPADQRYQ